MDKYAAHITENKTIHALEEHLAKVARRAGGYATGFGREWAELAGKWHDLGKYSAAFQKMIFEANGMEAHVEVEGAPGPRNHSTAGAIHAVETLGPAGRTLAYIIAGHHAGLPDWDKDKAPGASLRERLAGRSLLEDARKADIPEAILSGKKPEFPDVGFDKPQWLALWVRMLFSALVDADFLDTEAFYDPDKAARRGDWKPLAELKARFDAHMQALTETAEDTPVNRLRARVLADCRRAGREVPGFFSLTVPTGGGKTLSSMAFALEHARHHGKRRIIHVIPYTSIIEQTAEVFRGIFGDQVVEHHASLDPEREDHRSRLATENWDAPIIVTTSVQFFESLFAARTSRCRKLHNIADSVVVIDEAQLLPPSFLQPILNAMKLLAAHYGVSFVLSTATQPALNSRKDSFGRTEFEGLDHVREIVSDPDALYRELKRVRVEMPEDVHARVTWESLAEELARHESVLAIVDSRKDARDLFRLMPEGAIHLSALMCGEHRSQKIAEIKQRLREGAPTRVVSTQLVEAGVDLDFPVVYRALAGLDSIAQAAGRCNREGRLQQGRVVVFVPPRLPKKGSLLRHGYQTTLSILGDVCGSLLDRRVFPRFFHLFYDRQGLLDEKNLESLLRAEGDLSGMQFRTVAMRMRMIEDEGRALFVRFDEKSEKLLDQLRHAGPSRDLLRRLQRYAVSVPTWMFDKLLNHGDIEPVHGEFHAVVSRALYHKDEGLLLDDEAMDAEVLVQ